MCRAVAKAGWVALLSLAVLTCGEDPTAPAPVGDIADITATITDVSDPRFADLGRGMTISCEVAISATASGAGTAWWADAVLRWYGGADRSAPVDSQVIPASEVRKLWDLSPVPAESTATSLLYFSANFPFAVSIEFGYSSPGAPERRQTTVALTCGPEIPPGVAPPTIDTISVQDPGVPLGPEGEVVVDFTASSPVGLWQTAVVLTGPCDVVEIFDEKLARSSTHSARLHLPSTCALGVPILIGAVALDAALQDGGAVVQTGWISQDAVPPSLRLDQWGYRDPMYAGDTITVQFSAGDNAQLASLVWEAVPSGMRDSIALASTSVESMIRIVARPEWGGELSLRFWVHDGVGLASDTIVLLDPPVRVLPTIERPITTATVPGTTREVRVDDRRGRIYLLQADPDAVLALDAVTLAVIETIALPDVSPIDLDLTAGGDSLVVTFVASRALGILDLRDTPARLSVLPLASLDTTIAQYPLHVRTMNNGRTFVTLASLHGDGRQLLEVNLADGVERMRTDVGIGGLVSAALLETSYDRSVLVLNTDVGAQRYEASTDTFDALRSIASGWGPPSLDATGQYIVVSGAIYDETLTLLRWFEDAYAVALAVAPSGDVAYASGANGVRRAGLDDGRFLDRTILPAEPYHLRVSADGTWLVGTRPIGMTGTTAVMLVDLR